MKNNGERVAISSAEIFWTQDQTTESPRLCVRSRFFTIRHLRSPFEFYDTSGKSGLQLTSVLFVGKIKRRHYFTGSNLGMFNLLNQVSKNSVGISLTRLVYVETVYYFADLG